MLKLKHLIIGLGSIGKRHAQNLLENGQEVIGVDIDSKNGLSFPVYDNIESGWKSRPDMAWICTPTNLHAEQAIEALERKLHVFVEKPLAHDMKSAKAIQHVWEKMSQKRMIWVGCNMRFHPAVTRLKNAIDKGLIGKPLIHRIHFSHYLPNMRPETDYRNTYAAHAKQGGGIILDDIHDIDLALWLGGSVQKITGVAVNSGVFNIDAEDIAHISILHSNGAFSEIHMDFLRRTKSRGIEVVGENGTLEWRSFGKNPERASLNLFKMGEKNTQCLWQEEIGSFDEMFRQQLKSVFQALTNPDTYGRFLPGALEALKIALEIKAANIS